MKRPDEAKATIAAAKKDDDGFLVHEVRSPYQSKPTLIRVLQADRLHQGNKYLALYVLPVEAGIENRYGDGLKEIQKLDLQNKTRVIFVAPTFSQLPWYADHPTDPEIRQESHLLKVVLPFVEKNYPVGAEVKDRLLLGFSKSGWGAYSLLLRNPDTFAKAAAWDAPLMMDAPGKYGSGPIFGDAKNFEKYCVSKLLEANADKLRKERRLILHGCGNFRREHEQAHALLEKLRIPHDYKDGPERKHEWHNGWIAEVVEGLFAGK